jgi:hypothetical protein
MLFFNKEYLTEFQHAYHTRKKSTEHQGQVTWKKSENSSSNITELASSSQTISSMAVLMTLA